MKLISKEKVLKNIDFYVGEIKSGKIFIYPTDTLYGFGCDATNDISVQKIIDIKKRDSKPILVIAPSLEWIKENTDVTDIKFDYIDERLPGPYSFVLKLNDISVISKNVLQGRETLGIRIPDSWFTKIIQDNNLLFTTTSVNLSGEPSAVKISDIKDEILTQVDYVISDDLGLSGKGSTIIDMTGFEPVILRK